MSFSSNADTTDIIKAFVFEILNNSHQIFPTSWAQVYPECFENWKERRSWLDTTVRNRLQSLKKAGIVQQRKQLKGYWKIHKQNINSMKLKRIYSYLEECIAITPSRSARVPKLDMDLNLNHVREVIDLNKLPKVWQHVFKVAKSAYRIAGYEMGYLDPSNMRMGINAKDGDIIIEEYGSKTLRAEEI